MTPSILTAAQEGLRLAEKATKGPWKTFAPLPYVVGEEQVYSVEGPPSDFMFLRKLEDADLIAHCGTHHADICRELLRLHEEKEMLRAALCEYATIDNWGMGRRFDPNSSRFDGLSFAQSTLAQTGEENL